MNILASITSYHPVKQKYVKQIIDCYKAFKKHSVTVVLSTHYDFPKTDGVLLINNPYTDWEFTWGNDGYINSVYNDYDLIINTDDDILVTEENADYYRQHQNICLDYIPGFLTYEQHRDAKKMISIPNPSCPIEEWLTINGSRYFVPHMKHSAMFIADKQRYSKLFSNVKHEKYSLYPSPCMARTTIYTRCGMKKVIAVDGIKDNSALVRHLHNKYGGYAPFKLHTPETFLNTISL